MNQICRFCKSEELTQVVDLGKQPLANNFCLSQEEAVTAERFDLVVVRCGHCQLCQLTEVVDWKKIYTNYFYYSSSSKPLIEHYEILAARLMQYYRAGSSILDIGCNDGVMLDRFSDKIGQRSCVGIDPSSAAFLAEEKGYEVVRAIASPEVASQLVREHEFSIITATNVFAHIDNIDDLINALSILMGEETVLLIEAPYLFDMLSKNYFDTIYHEHYSYLSLTPVLRLFESHGFKIIDVKKSSVGASGPCMQYYITKADNTIVPTESVRRTMGEELLLKNSGLFEVYQNKIESWRAEIREILDKEISAGGRIGCISAPAKGNTLLNFIGSENISLVSEVNEKKIGSYTPGTGIPVVSEDQFSRSNVSLAIVLSWNYKEFFLDLKNHGKFGASKLMFPLPNIEIYE